MKKNVLKIIFKVSVFCLIFSFVLIPGSEFYANAQGAGGAAASPKKAGATFWGDADGKEDLKNLVKEKVVGSKTANIEDPRVIAAGIIEIILGFLGITSVIFILYGGWKWMMSKGAPDEIKGARDLMINAAIGLAIVLAAFSVAELIIDELVKAGGV